LRPGWRAALLPILLILPGHLPAAEAEPLRLAASPSLAETGFLDYLSALASAEGGFTLDWRALQPQEAMASAGSCEEDVLLIDSPEEESRFMNEGGGALHFYLMASDLLLLGPPDDPAGVLQAVSTAAGGSSSAAAALAAIARAGSPMVSSRADPAAFRVEGRLWKLGGTGQPEGEPWYIGPGSTAIESLRIAELRKAYIIVSRQTWFEDGGQDPEAKHSLSVMVEGDGDLRDQFSLIAVNPDACGKARLQEAVKFLQWAVSPRVQDLIGRFKWRGYSLYFPDAGTETCSTCQ
jgi:tungstate transport system substrate-binding protein